MTAFILVYIAIAFLRLKLIAPYFAMAIIGLIGLQIYIFSGLSYRAVSINSGFQYISISAFIIFYIVSLDRQKEYFMSVVIKYSTIYTLTYGFLALALYTGLFPVTIFQGLIANDLERGNRLFLYAAAAALAFFYWLQSAKRDPNPKHVILAFATFAAMLLSQSRVYILASSIIALLYIFTSRLMLIRLICLTAFWAMLLINLYGLLDPNWNPYAFFAGDSSGSFRINEYNLARTLITNHPWFGIGIAANASDEWFYIGQDFFFASDLGGMGVWIDWGLLGFIFFIFGTHVICTPVRTVAPDYSISLFLTGCLLAAFATIAPNIMYPGGIITFAIVLGFYLDRPSLGKGPLPWSVKRIASAA
jgi:hypothetical protein